MTTHTHSDSGSTPSRRWGVGGALVFCAFLLIAAFFILTEHRAHLFGWLPLLLLAACPLLHLFHHRGHGGGEAPADGAAASRDAHGEHGDGAGGRNPQ